MKVAAFSVCFTVVAHAHVPIERGVLSMFLSIQFRDIITMMTSRPILEMQAILDFLGRIRYMLPILIRGVYRPPPFFCA